MVREINFQNYLWTVPKQSWTGTIETSCGCPLPHDVWREMAGEDSMKAFDEKFPYKQNGNTNEVLVGMVQRGSQSGLAVLAKGPYKVKEISQGNASALSTVKIGRP
jgi:hypothetical protein